MNTHPTSDISRPASGIGASAVRNILIPALLSALLAVGSAPALRAQVPSLLTYQGRVQVQGSNFTGTGQFKLALVRVGLNTNQTATARAYVSLAGQVTNIVVLDGGTGYTSVPQVRITDVIGGGRGASAVASIGRGSVTSIRVTAGGSDYSMSRLPTVRLDPPPVGLAYITYWSHDGTSVDGSEPTSVLSVPVEGGLFMVRLGDTSLANMEALPGAVFTTPNLHLRIWFNDGVSGFVRLIPDQQLTTAPYAFVAQQAASLPSGANQTFTGSVSFEPPAGAPFTVGTTTRVANLNADLLDGLSAGAFWQVTGNVGTVAGANFLGTTDNQPLELKVNGLRALRLENNGDGSDANTTPDGAPNTIAGSPRNFVSAGVVGATIAGGGATNYAGLLRLNSVEADYGTVGGGLDNSVGAGTTAGTVAGGGYNDLGTNSDYATIGGGYDNNIPANAPYATIPGGRANAATNYAFAAGYRAKANHTGTFVWADSTAADFASTTNNQFSVRANGGVRFSTDASIYSDTPKGISLNAQDRPMITREWDKFSATAPNDKAGLGRWGLFMEPMHLVAGIPDADAGDRAFAVWAYRTDGTHTSLFWIRNLDGQAWFSNNVSVATLTIRGGADLAEPFAMSSSDVPAGALVVIDPAQPGRLKLSTRAYDRTVAGIVSGANGIQPGISMVQEATLEAGRNVALSGRVYALVDATAAPVEPGDLLTTSDTPGHAMKVMDHARGQGAIVGKAMSGLKHGQGLVLVLVSLQ